MRKGFTLVEIMIVLAILGILFVGLFNVSQPYLARSRDTKRVTDMQNYLNNVIGTYETTFDAFPSAFGSGGNPALPNYCLSDLQTRGGIGIGDIVALGSEGKFSFFAKDSAAVKADPTNYLVSPCIISGSYVYNKLPYGSSNGEAAIVAARLEMRTSSNYGTGADILVPARASDLVNAKKASLPIVPGSTPDQLFVITRLR